MFEKEEGGRGRKCCVLNGTVVKSFKHFMYKDIIIKPKYLINDSSSYITICMSCLLWNSTRSSRQDARGRTGDGGRGVSFETISPSIRSGPSFPHYMCQWARRLSRVKLAVILCRSMCGYISGTRYRFQVTRVRAFSVCTLCSNILVVLRLTRHHNAVRGHRTGSNNSGVEDYLRRKLILL